MSTSGERGQDPRVDGLRYLAEIERVQARAREARHRDLHFLFDAATKGETAALLDALVPGLAAPFGDDPALAEQAQHDVAIITDRANRRLEERIAQAASRWLP